VGNATPSLFLLPSLPIPFPPLRCCKVAPWKPARGSGSSVSFPSGVRGEAPAAYAFLCILSLKNRTWQQHFFKQTPKKQLYRQEVPERRSKIYTNNNFRKGNLKFPGGNSPPAICLDWVSLMSGRITGASIYTRQLTRINYRQLVFDRPCSNTNTTLIMPDPEPQLDLSRTFLRVHARNQSLF